MASASRLVRQNSVTGLRYSPDLKQGRGTLAQYSHPIKAINPIFTLQLAYRQIKRMSTYAWQSFKPAHVFHGRKCYCRRLSFAYSLGPNWPSPFYLSYMYKEATAVMSLLIISCALCILVNSAGSPIILAAFFTSLHVSSSLVMTRTIMPSSTSVRSVMWLNDIPLAHSYTTSTRPNLGRLTKSFESLLESITWCSI